MSNDCAGGDDGAFPDVHAGKDGGGGADPHVPSDRDRFRRDEARRLSGSTGWPAVTRLTFDAIMTSSVSSCNMR
jgi:hypothetical protein